MIPWWSTAEQPQKAAGPVLTTVIVGGVFNRLCRKRFQTTGEDFSCQQEKYPRCCTLSCPVGSGAD